MQSTSTGSFKILVTALLAIKPPAMIVIQEKLIASFIINGKKKNEIRRLEKIPSIKYNRVSDMPEMIMTLSILIKKSVPTMRNKTLSLAHRE